MSVSYTILTFKKCDSTVGNDCFLLVKQTWFGKESAQCVRFNCSLCICRQSCSFAAAARAAAQAAEFFQLAEAMNVQKGKISQQSGPYQNQQGRSNSTAYNLLAYDGDATQSKTLTSFSIKLSLE